LSFTSAIIAEPERGTVAVVSDDLPALVIFDCDGVLVDSEPISTSVLATCLTAAGVPTSAPEALVRYRGMLLVEVAQHAEQQLGGPLPDGFLESFEHAREAAFRATLAPIAGARDTVLAVKAAGVTVCVASQGKRSKTDLTLTLTGLRDLFGDDALFSADDVERGKPHPDLFLHAAAAMGVAPSLSAVVEDTTIGVTAATAAGMRVVGYAGEEDPAPLLRAGADATVGELTAVPGALGLGHSSQLP
jgi:HAD superfamily hydrolase (TIGR01509 family)